MPFPRIAGYEFVAETAGGNFGSIYKAYSEKLGRTVAVKVLPAHLAKDDRVVARFAREAQALLKLDHPNIVRVLDHGSEGRTHFLALEWLDGMPLEQEIENLETFPAEEEFLRVFGACAEGLAFAHRQGVVHRDLTPANIFLTMDKQVKLVDFGFAKLLAEATISATGEILGSAPYMAPEQFQNSAAVDHIADIFSLGAVGYRYATGKFPCGSDQPAAILKRMADPAFQITPPIVFNRNISVKTDSILRKCLEMDPRKRYQSVEGILTDIKYGDPDEPVGGYVRASMPGALMPPAARPAGTHKNRKWIWIAAVSVLILAAAGFVAWKKKWFKPEADGKPTTSRSKRATR
ncbi:serine/threonine protein kinase [bacterium]|nr:serine/threonine protein kinase [bacterium]